jgi:hypothetical protein
VTFIHTENYTSPLRHADSLREMSLLLPIYPAQRSVMKSHHTLYYWPSMVVRGIIDKKNVNLVAAELSTASFLLDDGMIVPKSP